MSFFLSPLLPPGRGGDYNTTMALGLSFAAEETVFHLPWGSPVSWLLSQLASPLPHRLFGA